MHKRRAKTLKTFGLLLEPTEKAQSLTNTVYEDFPREFEQQIARDFWIYILIR
jgi:hypothetical protein